LKKRFLLPSF